MPELGESVHEGTVSRWLKGVGDFVKEDEPVVEIMTDKVNTELPSPASGILTKILVPEGELVKVFHAMGIIEEAGLAAETPSMPGEVAKSSVTPEPYVDVVPKESTRPHQSGDRKWFSPVVRSIAKQHDISDEVLSGIVGTGNGGRVTKRDIEEYLGREPQAASKPVAERQTAAAAAGTNQEVLALSPLRKMIGDAMARSSQVPVVSTVTQVDVTPMVQFRERNKDSFHEQHGVKLTYTPFFIKALSESLIEFPLVNSSLQADQTVVMNRSVHMGVAVALGSRGDEGLIVPVIRDCHTKSLVELAKDLEFIARKARDGKLGVADVQGGTFTLTNPGSYGALFGTPMINAPQAGIAGAYAIQKMPVIVDDMIAIRSVMHLVLTYDHRLIDGLLAGRFLASVKERLQGFDFLK